MDTVILIPAYKPDKKLINTILPLYEKGLSLLVVNDGSPKEYDGIFKEAEAYATVLSYAKNQGKGAALKHGIRYIAEQLPGCRFFVTADGDGQHAVEDILRACAMVREKGGIVLGVREFEGKAPLRSRIGNDMSRVAYTIASGMYLSDNQCGLRGFDASLAPWLLTIKGSKYDYEMNVLMRAARDGMPLSELTVKAIYLNENKSSHFRPLTDTLLIHKRIWMTAWISVAALLSSIALTFVLWEFFSRYPLGPELCFFGSRFGSLLLSLILISIFVPALYGHIFRHLLPFIARGTISLAVMLVFVEFFCRALRIPLPYSYLLSSVFTTAAKYLTLKGLHISSRPLPAGSQKKITNEKI